MVYDFEMYFLNLNKLHFKFYTLFLIHQGIFYSLNYFKQHWANQKYCLIFFELKNQMCKLL